MTPARNVLFFQPVKCTLLHFQSAAAVAAISWKPKTQQGNMGKKYFRNVLFFSIPAIQKYSVFQFELYYQL